MALFTSQRAHPAQAPVPVPDPPGTAAASLLKRYRPLETRAAGGFGSVEICLDGRLQRRVAIKRMPLATPRDRTSHETTASALNEARTASMLQHPNIVSVIDFTYDSAHAYLVMEYVDGMSLEEFLAQVEGNSLTYDEAACIADALVQALSYAHENGVLHLDIKPANILIDRSGHVKITDFGMATLTSAAGFGGARGGTIGYMPPEQLRGDVVDERTDIFSLASLLYEALCGTAPFRAASPIDSMTLINEGVEPPSTVLPQIPELSEEALLTALDPDPAMRMRSVSDFGDRFLAGLGSPREGRRSLARMIDLLTSEEEGGESGDETERDAPGPDIDPAEGRLGSRWPSARMVATGAITGISVAITSHALLGCMGLGDPVARSLAALAIGSAAFAAPQIGSALVCTGILAMVVGATAPLSAIPGAVLILALASAWWLVWGRASAPASAALVSTIALTAALGGPGVAVAPAAAAAGYLLAPAPAGIAVALGTLLGSLAATALSAGGALPFHALVEALASPALAVTALGLSGLSAALSFVLGRAWDRYRDDGSTGAFLLAYALPLPCCAALPCLVNPMEIAALPIGLVATALGTGALSSILIWICAFTLGYRKDPEGDHS